MYESIKELFDEYGVDYKTRGKNISSGWIGLQCPFCGDSSNHLGINLKDNSCKCWICGRKSLAQVISILTEIKFSQAIKIAKNLIKEKTIPFYKENNEEKIFNKSIKLPLESSSKFPDLHLNYLRSRGFPPLKTIRKWRLKAVNNLGKYKFRIIIPIYINHKLVNFTSRDVTNKQDPKYKHASESEIIIPRSECVFNIDSIIQGGDAILVEGPMDVMKLGSGSVCFFGVEENQEQIILLKNKRIRNLYIVFDNDKAGQKNAKRIARIFAPLVQKVEVVFIKNVKDPGELSIEDAQAVKYNLDFNI